MASHHRCPPASALVGAAPVGFWSRSLSEEVLEQAAPLAKLPLPNACRGGHCLALLTCSRSHVDRVRWHSPSCRVAHLRSDAPSTSPPPVAKGQHHVHVASTRGCRSSHSLCRLRSRVHVLQTSRRPTPCACLLIGRVEVTRITMLTVPLCCVTNEDHREGWNRLRSTS
jgi:hypothetical protein